jgi:hypothetical protein
MAQDTTLNEPTTTLDPNFSAPDAVATPWEEALAQLEKAEIFWLSTVRPDGRPHVTPLVSVWLDGAAHFTTGPTERKARNLERNPHVVLTTGCNQLGEGTDLVVEGDAVQVTDEATLQRVADAIAFKYGEPFLFSLRDGALWGDGGEVLAFWIRPTKAFGFARSPTFGQTRWLFSPD